MTTQDLLATIEEGLENGRITPYLAAFIASEVLGVEPLATGYDDRIRLDDAAPAAYVVVGSARAN